MNSNVPKTEVIEILFAEATKEGFYEKMNHLRMIAENK